MAKMCPGLCKNSYLPLQTSNNPCYDNDLDKRFLINVIKLVDCKALPPLPHGLVNCLQFSAFVSRTVSRRVVIFDLFSLSKLSENNTTHLCPALSPPNSILYSYNH